MPEGHMIVPRTTTVLVDDEIAARRQRQRRFNLRRARCRASRRCSCTKQRHTTLKAQIPKKPNPHLSPNPTVAGFPEIALVRRQVPYKFSLNRSACATVCPLRYHAPWLTTWPQTLKNVPVAYREIRIRTHNVK